MKTNVAENAIIFPPELYMRDVRKFGDEFRHLIEFRGYRWVVLDFSQTRTAFAEQILPLVCCALRYRQDGVRFRLLLPIFDRLSRLFANCGWAHLIAPEQFRQTGVQVMDNVPAISFADHSRQDQIVNQSVDRILRQMPHLARDNLRAIEWAINEICDNVPNHSDSPIGGIFQLNVRPRAKEVEFIVIDAGIGIPNSLRSIHPRDWNDEFALEQSIQRGVTRDADFGQGNGLFGTYQIAALSGGTFHINSGSAHLVVTRDGTVQVRPDPEAFLGTMIVCAVNFSQPALLERALRFQGDDYRMIDYIEMKYETSDHSMAFSMREEAESMGNRRSGFHVRRKILNLLSYGGDVQIVCDMNGVGVMSSSFADEVFGKLAAELGKEEFRKKIAIINVAHINQLIVTSALRQRLGIGIE